MMPRPGFIHFYQWCAQGGLKCPLGSQKSVPKCPLGWQNTQNCPHGWLKHVKLPVLEAKERAKVPFFPPPPFKRSVYATDISCSIFWRYSSEILRYLLPHGSRMDRLWLGRVLSYRVSLVLLVLKSWLMPRNLVLQHGGLHGRGPAPSVDIKQLIQKANKNIKFHEYYIRFLPISSWILHAGPLNKTEGNTSLLFRIFLNFFRLFFTWLSFSKILVAALWVQQNTNVKIQSRVLIFAWIAVSSAYSNIEYMKT